MDSAPATSAATRPSNRVNIAILDNILVTSLSVTSSLLRNSSRLRTTNVHHGSSSACRNHSTRLTDSQAKAAI